MTTRKITTRDYLAKVLEADLERQAELIDVLRLNVWADWVQDEAKSDGYSLDRQDLLELGQSLCVEFGYCDEVANALKQLYPAAKRGLQNQGGGAAVPDVEGTPAWIECKRYKRVPGAMSLWYRLLKEAQRPPVLILREDRAKPVAMVSLGFLVGLLDSVGDDLTAIEQKGQEILEVGDED